MHSSVHFFDNGFKVTGAIAFRKEEGNWLYNCAPGTESHKPQVRNMSRPSLTKFVTVLSRVNCENGWLFYKLILLIISKWKCHDILHSMRGLKVSSFGKTHFLSLHHTSTANSRKRWLAQGDRWHILLQVILYWGYYRFIWFQGWICLFTTSI